MNLAAFDPPIPAGALLIWVIYRRPKDMPEHEYVLRPQWPLPGGAIQPYAGAWVAETLEEIRGKLFAIAPDVVSLGRSEQDEPHIVETYI